jgi:hypothetical protein
VCPPGTFFLNSIRDSDAHSLCWLQSFQYSVVHSLHSLKNPETIPTNSQIENSIYPCRWKSISYIYNIIHKHTNDIHSKHKTHTIICRKNCFVLISECLYNVYKDWTATESQFSPLFLSTRSSYLMLDLMKFDTKIFYKRGASRALPPSYLLSLITLNYIQWPSSPNRI